MWPFGPKLTAEEKKVVDGCKAAIAYIDSLPGKEISRDQYLAAWQLAGQTIPDEVAKQTFRDAYDVARRETPPVDHLEYMRAAMKRHFKKAIANPAETVRNLKKNNWM